MNARRVLLLGNSMLGCVKLALDKAPELLGYPFDYMGTTNQWGADLKIVDGVLGPGSEEGRKLAARLVGMKSDIAVKDYDAFVFVGMGVAFYGMGQIYYRHRLPGHITGPQQLLSQAAYEASAADLVTQSVASKTAAKLRRVSDAPLLTVPEPLPSRDIAGDPEWGDAWSMGHVPALLETYQRHMQQVFGQSRANVLPQPAETIADQAFTKPDDGLGAVRIFRNKHRNTDTDRRHMNDEYGRLLCIEIARWLKSRLP